MLVLTRSANQSIMIGDDVVVKRLKFVAITFVSGSRPRVRSRCIARKLSLSSGPPTLVRRLPVPARSINCRLSQSSRSPDSFGENVAATPQILTYVDDQGHSHPAWHSECSRIERPKFLTKLRIKEDSRGSPH